MVTKKQRAEQKREQYLRMKVNKSVRKLCDHCNNPFYAFGSTRYCSLRGSSFDQWKKSGEKKKRLNKTKNDWKERWAYFWSRYYRLSKKDKEKYFEDFKKTITDIYV